MPQHRKPLAALTALAGLAATILISLAGSAAPAGAAGCTLTPTNGTVTRTVWVGAELRSYNLRVPTGMTGQVPLLVDMHGLGSNAFFQEVTSGWSPYADANKFIVAYPAGSFWGQAWNVNQGSPDVTFIRKMVDQIKSAYCVDSTRVYAEGGSLGGFMSQRLACDAEDVFASIVSTISGPYNYFGGTCSLSRPVAAGFVNSEDDPLFPVAQSKAARDKWLSLNHCSSTGTPETNTYGLNAAIYGGCDGGVHVLWRTYTTGAGHSYPAGAARADFHDRTWSFLLAHAKP
jgi:polyhydroxybutyrate depolymerase